MRPFKQKPKCEECGHVHAGKNLGGTPVGPQAFGSAETYLRRYALQSMLGIPAADDDGNAASGMEAKDAPPPKPSGAEQVRGALARPPTASAKKATTPTPEGNEVIKRVLAFSAKATAAGYTTAKLRDYAARVLQSKKPSAEFTLADVEQLEAAWGAETAP